ncbi:MAG: efflux RND transporter permease subunit [Phascolarctobacterium sp.]|uniref:efflux RND transporter permease subunit n=1 Tax=Phascolarctobacterium sp. TaxID=2049039 RepID=UPI0026DADDFD|nr:efflux RND transporter permease subunit [Phascolarctobacterium sp.]MDO4921213.1 efflux RND transporter permease subunit [Phascolarctobacterium sp.]
MIGTFIKRPVFTTMFILLLVVFGIRCYPEIGVDLNPDVDLPIVSVRVTYDGASPEEMETLVTKPIENRVSQVSGIKTLSSTVLEGYSETVLEFNLGVDPQVKASEVREKVSSVRKSLPDDIDEPVTQTVDLNARAIVAYTFSSTARSRGEIRRIIEDNISDELQMVDGVSEVTVLGASQRAIRIVLKPEKMAEYGISYHTIRDIINKNNYNTPGGKARSKDMEITVRTVGKYNTVDDVKKVVVANDNGRPVYIGEVADVLDDWEDEDTFASANGVPSVMAFVRKQSKTNTVDVTDNVNAKMELLKKSNLPPDIIVEKVRDQSTYIRENIADVWNTILFGGFLALLITYLFLRNFRATIVGGLCIPTSVVATFFMMKVMDFTLNNMSLMALSLAIGMLIDDAIVVIENIFRHIEMGETPFVAARKATEELTLAILATSFTLMAVFVPIGNMGEIIGQFFKQFGLTVAFAVAFSTIVAFSLTPMVSAYWIKVETEEESARSRNKYLQWTLDKFEAGFQSVRQMYNDLMAWALERPKSVVTVGVISLGLNLLLLPFVGTEYQPTYDSGEFTVNFKAPYGTSLMKTVELATPMQQYVSGLPEVKIVALNIGNGRNPVNQGALDIRLKPSGERQRSMQQIMDELRGRFGNVEGLKVTVVSNQGGGRGDSRPVQIGLRGNNIKELRQYALDLAEMVRNTPGATDVDISDSEEEPEIIIRLDHAKASELGLDATYVGEEVEMAFMGKSTSNSYTIGDNDYDVILQMDHSRRTDINDVMNLRISSSDGTFVRLGDIASVDYGSGPTRIEREDKQRQIVVYANTVGISPGDLITKITDEYIPAMNMPPGYNYKKIGQADNMARSFAEITKAVILAIVVVYMVLAAQFESFSQPLIIMTSLPFAVIGAVLGLLVAGQTANMMSLIGFTMLLGLVTKNAILLLDYANQARERGLPLREAVLEACSLRLRPIFMTTLSTLLGMLPIALGVGEGAELRQSMGVVLIGGLTTSTLLTLVVVPLIYLLFEDWKEKHYVARGE